MSEANPYDATKSLSEVNAHAWAGDALGEDDPIRCDRQMLVFREAVDPDRIWRVPHQPTSTARSIDVEDARKAWQNILARELRPVTVEGVSDVSDVTPSYHTHSHVAVLSGGDGGARIYMNAHKLRLACYWTRADSLKGAGPHDAVVLYRGDEPVGAVMPLRSTVAEHEVVSSDA